VGHSAVSDRSLRQLTARVNTGPALVIHWTTSQTRTSCRRQLRQLAGGDQTDELFGMVHGLLDNS